MRFCEDGAIRLGVSDDVAEIKGALLEVKQLEDEQVASLRLTWKWSGKIFDRIKTLGLKIREEYPTGFFVGNKDRAIGLESEVRKVFGYDAVAKFQKTMGAGKIRASII